MKTQHPAARLRGARPGGLRSLRTYLGTSGAAATPNFRHLEWFHDHVRIENLFFAGTLDPDGRCVRPSAAPGKGLVFRSAGARPDQVQ
jgi:hypothetical protein